MIELIYNKDKYKTIQNETLSKEIEVTFWVKDNLLGGGCLKKKGGVYGDNCDLYGFFQELLLATLFLLSKGKNQRFTWVNTKKIKKNAKDRGFTVGDIVYWTTLFFSFNEYFFELDEDRDEVVIYYYNDPLFYTDCEEFKGKERNSIRLPLKEFTEEIMKLAKEYLRVLEMPVAQKSGFIDSLKEYLNEVEKYYREKYGGYRDTD